MRIWNSENNGENEFKVGGGTYVDIYSTDMGSAFLLLEEINRNLEFVESAKTFFFFQKNPWNSGKNSLILVT